MAPLVWLQYDVGGVDSWIGALGGRVAEDGFQRALGFDQKPIERAVQSGRGGLGHGPILAPDRSAAN
ncbi:hypothetical protein XVE_1428 [Xanthomonas vesicatoria ATCC 35937]|uniref:Uncharacterized protein n=1 Tax=Xanthomonas vesicatoria ATCC 35937 TaxID=925775 RepID=F0BBF8_9XANT|nr:hypothetical protein XVE_1428 [Xanthomonas vesicatoria ATCC 35937]